MKTGYAWKSPKTEVSIPAGRTHVLPPPDAPQLPGAQERVYVEVLAEFTPDGRVRPVAIRWEDGRIFEVERISGHCRCLCPFNRETGRRFACEVRGKTVYLYYDELCSWYVRRRGTGKEGAQA